ncbi:hypothetical protein [Allopontixanthobacter sp.]|uniref:DUF7940 domain-containing protein n=1 Tax=Allopontixanthobacter sp. TaxID=2906452 RepID=UPI002AB99B68|nr:hypothetical protein [Allopontixanthobacter sp.]MDZ4307541.1 hypothetical protein [Allopontixanthobacter sp.]
MKKSWLIDSWHEAWRFISLWVNTVGFGVLVAWNQMPRDVRAILPEGFELVLMGGWWLAVIVGRLCRQPGSQAKIDAKRRAQASGQGAPS